MHRTDAPGHVGNLHVDLNPPTPGTVVAAATLNASQEELCGFVEDLGIVLVKGTNTQVKTAIRALFATNRASIIASVAGNALTVAIKNLAGVNASAEDPMWFSFIDSANPASGILVPAKLTGASSIVISSGSTLGTVDATAFTLHLVMFKDGSTLRPALLQVGTDSIAFRYPLDSATAEGGSGGADSADVYYSNAAISAKALVYLGTLKWESGLATAGTWNAGPSKVRPYGRGLI